MVTHCRILLADQARRVDFVGRPHAQPQPLCSPSRAPLRRHVEIFLHLVQIAVPERDS